MAAHSASVYSSPLSSPYVGPSVVLSGPSSDSISPYVDDPNGLICRWNGCGMRFTEFGLLAEHLSDHIDASGFSFVCQWDGCSYRGHPLPSFADLRSHLQSHIDVSDFASTRRSRSIHQSLPTRLPYYQNSAAYPMDDHTGRKRKRSLNSHQSPTNPNPKRLAANDRPDPSVQDELLYPQYHDAPTSPGYISASLEQQAAPDGSIMGRPRELVRYLIAKAKLRHVTDENEVMKAELRSLKRQEERLLREKDALLNDVMLREFGPQAMQLVNEPALPEDGSLAPWVTFTAKGVDFS